MSSMKEDPNAFERVLHQGKNYQKKMLIWVVALAMSLSYSACRADNRIPSSVSSQMPTEVLTQIEILDTQTDSLSSEK